MGRTHPETSEEDMKAIFLDNTASYPLDGVVLSIVEVINTPKDNNGRDISKSWRVTFPFEHKERMMDA